MKIISGEINTCHEREKLNHSLLHGIPQIYRGKVWGMLSYSHNVSLNYEQDFFNLLLQVKNEKIETYINKDIERTILQIGDEVLNTQTQQSRKSNLFKILKAYSVFDPQVGYCQGTNFIVLMLLSNIPSAREAFWVFVQIMHNKNWRHIYTPNTPKLINLLDTLAERIKCKLGDLYQHFEKEFFVELFPGVFTHYFTTIFSYNSTFEFSNRIMDLFWIFEENIIIDTIIHLLRMKKDILTAMNLEDLIVFIKNDLVRVCVKEYGLEYCLPPFNSCMHETEVEV